MQPIITLIFSFSLQVLYLLNQLRNKSMCESSEKQTQKDEDESHKQELLQRLKIQVSLIKVNFPLNAQIHFKLFPQ